MGSHKLLIGTFKAGLYIYDENAFHKDSVLYKIESEASDFLSKNMLYKCIKYDYANFLEQNTQSKFKKLDNLNMRCSKFLDFKISDNAVNNNKLLVATRNGVYEIIDNQNVKMLYKESITSFFVSENMPNLVYVGCQGRKYPYKSFYTFVFLYSIAL